MTEVVRIILLEDVRDDAELIVRRLTKAMPSADVLWTRSREEYKSALADFNADIVISDHSLPGFNSVEAFRLLKESGRNIPFILATATISEEFAVTMMREGIADYLLKDRLERLPLAVANVLEKWQVEREKERSVEMLVENEQRFRSLIENSHDMIVVKDADRNHLFASPSYARITGRTLEERIRQKNIDFIHPDDRSQYYETIDNARRVPNQYFPLLYRAQHKDEHFIWLEGTVINLIGDKAIKGILFNLRDVTDRKNSEDSLKKSQANLNAIIENTSVSIYSIDRQFRYISFNSFLKNSLKQVYGLDIHVGDVVFDFLSLFDPSELDGWRERYTEAFAGNRVEFEKEFRIGEYYACLSFAINPIVEDHFVTGLSCFAWDITAQKIAASKVAQSEARFRALIENNYDAIVMRDEQRKILYASPSVKRMLGYTAEETYEGIYEQFIHPDDLEIVTQAYRNLMTQPGVPFSLSMRLKKKNGHYMWTEGTITNMLHNESVRGIVSNFRDVSERKEGELQRERITLDLIERNKNLEQYAYIVSHNLRAPVANILGISNLLEMAGSNGKDKEQSLGHLFDSARRLDDVIKDLNMILQLQQSINEQREEVDLAELVRDIELSIQELVRKSKVEITTNFSKVKSITTVKSYLYSIFYNLITNSIKYKQEGTFSLVTITSEMSGDHTKITFVDNGLGIDLAAYGSKLFGLYKRFHPDHAEGKGVGLFMTKTQVEALGGKISVKSQVNIGTEFIIEL